MKFYINGKRVSKKALIEMEGEKRVNSIVKESIETFKEDPNTCISYMISKGMLTVEVV